jgi:hypothetical protein
MDHRYVELVTGWLETEWNPANYPGTYGGDVPTIIDGDDSASQSFEGREVAYDLSKNNAVVVSSTPTRQNDSIGTEFDYRFEDGVAIEAVGLHADEWGHVTGSAEFRALYQEVRRIVHNHRVWPDRNPGGSQHSDKLYLADESNNSSQYGDLYVWNATAATRGFEEL